uniref:Uncharacterized protein n=1 Tax=Rhizophora mucronata TaxID=61149 RepID=A0A2P2Q2K1_RHIMU
MQAKREIL